MFKRFDTENRPTVKEGSILALGFTEFSDPDTLDQLPHSGFGASSDCKQCSMMECATHYRVLDKKLLGGNKPDAIPRPRLAAKGLHKAII